MPKTIEIEGQDGHIKKTRLAKIRRQRKYLLHYLDCGDKTEAGNKTGVPSTTWCRWFLYDDDFNELFDKHFPSLEKDLLPIALKRAKKSSDVLLIFLMKAINRARYDERHYTEEDVERIVRNIIQFSEDDDQESLDELIFTEDLAH